jgi:hypothetical protein
MYLRVLRKALLTDEGQRILGDALSGWCAARPELEQA